MTLEEHFEDDSEDQTCPVCGDIWSGTSCGIPDCDWIIGDTDE